MVLNIAAIGGFLKAIKDHPATKAGTVATFISAGLYAAQFAGAPIPNLALLAGPFIGAAIYKFLPKKAQAEVDIVINGVEELATEVPQTYSDPKDFPNAPPVQTTNNLNKDIDPKPQA